MLCFFVSDLHGKVEKYLKLFKSIQEEKPKIVLLGGDLLPHYFSGDNFVIDFLTPEFLKLRAALNSEYPQVLLILGNDDAKREEQFILKAEEASIWKYISSKTIELNGLKILGYSYTNPSPFLLKDWERYDVSRYIEPGCISPEDGKRTVEIDAHEKKYSTIKNDLAELTANIDLDNVIILFHAPPYNTNLDRAALDGRKIDGVPLDVHVGSIAIRKFIEEKQPLITLHGHIHESTRITGSWNDKIGNTFCFNAAHDGPELAIVKFDTQNPGDAKRFLL